MTYIQPEKLVSRIRLPSSWWKSQPRFCSTQKRTELAKILSFLVHAKLLTIFYHEGSFPGMRSRNHDLEFLINP